MAYPRNGIGADGYCRHFMHSSACATVHELGFWYWGQIAWKKCLYFWHADVSRWLALSLSVLMGIIVRPSIHHIFRFLCICRQITCNEWHKHWHVDVFRFTLGRSMPMGIVVILCICPSVRPSIGLGSTDKSTWHADVSRWLTPIRHQCRWVLLSFLALVRPSNCPWAWVLVLRTNCLEEMVYISACWCILMIYTQFIDAHGYYCLSVRSSVHLGLGLGLARGWLLPSLGDTGDICCHYWQHIIVLWLIGLHLGCLYNPIFSNLELCAACWARFMCHHELWPTSVSHPFSSLNSSLSFAGRKHYQKITL